MSSGRFNGKTIMITGAASGLGAAVARQVSDEGGSVVVVDRDGAGARAVAAALPSALAVETDISDPDAVRDAFAQTAATFGRLHGLHANAGIAGPLATIVDVEPSELHAVFQVNLVGTFLCVQAAIREMLRSGTADSPDAKGSIVITASALGLMGAEGASPYAMSKHALVGLTKCAGLEYGRHGVRVNALCPGYIDTPLMRPTERVVGNGDESIGRKAIESSIALGRYARVEEVAGLATWLLSDESSYANGAQFSIDAGLAAGLNVSSA